MSNIELHSISIQISKRGYKISCNTREYKETGQSYIRTGRRIPKEEINSASRRWSSGHEVYITGIFDNKEAGIEKLKEEARKDIEWRRQSLSEIDAALPLDPTFEYFTNDNQPQQ